MKIFVAGATGVLGRRVVPLLVAAGHEVTAVARTPEAAERLRAAGATPVTVDLFDPAAVAAAVRGHDVICNLATHVPPTSKAWRPSAWAEHDRIRTEASRNLAEGGLAAGVGRYIQESIAFRYADGGERWVDEDTPLDSPTLARSADDAEASVARFSAGGGEGVVLRFGLFYGADSAQTGEQVRLAAAGVAPVLGPAGSYRTMIHLDDAAAAVVAALSVAPGIYNVTEDDPGTNAEIAAALGAAVGVAPGVLPPAWLPKVGGANTSFLARSLRVSNRRFREATGWAPAYPGPWEGWRQVVGATPPRRQPGPGRNLWIRASLVFLAGNAALVGLWATLAPLSFFKSFPGLGLHWVEVDGPYNEHLTRDAGSFMLALLVLTLAALFSYRRSLLRITGVAWLVSALPHFLYHLFNRDIYAGGDQIGTLGGLAMQWILGVALIALAPPSPAPTLPPRPAASRPPVARAI